MKNYKWEKRFTDFFVFLPQSQKIVVNDYLYNRVARERALAKRETAKEIIELLEKIKYVEGTKELAIFTVNPIILELKVKYIKKEGKNG